jgi:hypothetical protein
MLLVLIQYGIIDLMLHDAMDFSVVELCHILPYFSGLGPRSP